MTGLALPLFFNLGVPELLILGAVGLVATLGLAGAAVLIVFLTRRNDPPPRDE